MIALFLFLLPVQSQTTLSPNTDYITEFGKMWTFDDLPLDYFKDKYDFQPGEEWIEKLQKSALQFGGGCSAAFLSEDGLIMTNHHCARHGLRSVEKEGEDLFKNGFFAEKLDDERKINGMYVDQLLLIEDVTDEVISAMEAGKTDKEKIEWRDNKISELEAVFSDKTGLVCKVVTLYNGAKFSMYCYKRYNDIRVVMAPTFQIASTGWDWDNFTYPRYELDFMFLRAYENDEPAQITNCFRFNPDGAEPGEPIFIIGRPGDTDRQLSVVELEYIRDVTHPFMFQYLDEMYNVYFELFKKYPERESELLNRVMGIGNSLKVYEGQLAGLRNEELMNRKRAFEKELNTNVKSDERLNKKYGHVWKALENLFEEKRGYGSKFFVYNLLSWGRSEYLTILSKFIDAIEQLRLPEDKRMLQFSEELKDSTLMSLYPEEFDEELNKMLLRVFVSSVYHELDGNKELIQKLFNNKKGDEAVEYLLSNSFLANRDKYLMFVKKDPDEILQADDPFIYFISNTKKEKEKISERTKEIDESLSVLNQELGDAIYKVYGDRIPPDATLTLRLSDGVIKGYEYNGTLAPPKTTYYGMYDRYYSFGEEKYPWGLPELWQTVPDDLDLETPLNFASTLDIVGGNSGSSIVNKNAEVIGLVFDGNMESLPGDYLYMPENNRAVAVDAKGLIEALKHVYKTERLVEELLNGKLSE